LIKPKSCSLTIIYFPVRDFFSLVTEKYFAGYGKSFRWLRKKFFKRGKYRCLLPLFFHHSFFFFAQNDYYAKKLSKKFDATLIILIFVDL